MTPEEELALREKINNSLTEYLKRVKELGVLEESINHIIAQRTALQAQLAAAQAAGNAALVTQYTNELALLNTRLTEIEAYRDALRDILQTTNKVALATGAVLKTWSKLPDLAKDALSYMRGLEAVKMSKDIKTAELSMGVLSKQSQFFSNTMQKASKTTIQLGFGISDMAKSQMGYSDEIGRSVMLSQEGYQAMAEMAKGTMLGTEGAASMAADMENFGLSVESSRDVIQETVDIAHRMGVNSNQAVKGMTKTLKIAQRFNFKGGTKGMAEMSNYAVKMKMDMGSVASMADKVFRPEGAVEMAARLQTLGGSFARLGDPFALMFKARNDFEGFSKDVGKAAADLAHWDGKKGEFGISGLQLDRMRELAKITGLSEENLSEMAKRSAQFNKIKSLIPPIGTEEDRELISSLAQFDKKSGKWKVKIGTDTKALDAISEADLKNYKQEQETLAERAKQSQTFDDSLANLILRFKTLLLPFVETLNKIVEPMIAFHSDVNNSKLVNGLVDFSVSMGNILVGLGKFVMNNPITSALLLFGGKILFNALQWYANGRALWAGFNAGGFGAALGGTQPAGGGGTGGGLAGAGAFGTTTGGGFSSNMTSALNSNTLKLGGAIAGLTAAVFEFSENSNKGMGTGENIGRSAIKGGGAGLGAWGGAAAGAAIGAGFGGVGAIPGAIIGGLLGGMGGSALGEGAGDVVFGNEVNDGIIKFNPRDKFLQMNDGLVASTDKGKIDDIAKTSKSDSKSVSGEVKMTFDDIVIKGQIQLVTPDGKKIDVDILDDPLFIREIGKLIREEARMAIGGGKLNPNPLN